MFGFMNCVGRLDFAALFSQSGGGFGDDFVFTIETTTADETFTIPTRNIGSYSCSVDWGDGQTSEVTAWDSANLAHSYSEAGTHTIRVSGTFPAIFFNFSGDRLKMRTVEQFGDVGWLTFDQALYGCQNLTDVTSGTCDVSGVTSFNRMLRACSGLQSVDLSTFNVAAGAVLSEFFRDASSSDLSEIDLSGLADSAPIQVQGMFRNCGSPPFNVIGLEDIDVSNVQANRFADFSRFSTLSVRTYDALLARWSALDVVNDQTVDFGNSKYTGGGAAADARASLIADQGWTISDAGTV